MRILIVDDDEDALNIMSANLKPLGLATYQARNGTTGLRQAQRLTPDLIVLDVSLPDISGWEVCQQIRAFSDVPILMVSGFAVRTEDEVAALHEGADDYLIKPIDSSLFREHVLALLRRSAKIAWAAYHPAYLDRRLVIDLVTHEVCVEGQSIKLSPLEYSLLEILVGNIGQTVPVVEIVEQLWTEEAGEQYAYTVRNYIQRLRQKIEPDSQHPSYILNERGFGYKFDPC